MACHLIKEQTKTGILSNFLIMIVYSNLQCYFNNVSPKSWTPHVLLTSFKSLHPFDVSMLPMKICSSSCGVLRICEEKEWSSSCWDKWWWQEYEPTGYASWQRWFVVPWRQPFTKICSRISWIQTGDVVLPPKVGASMTYATVFLCPWHGIITSEPRSTTLNWRRPSECCMISKRRYSFHL